MVNKEKYLKSINSLIEKGINLEKLKMGIMADHEHGKITYTTYTEAIKILEKISKTTLESTENANIEKSKSTLITTEITDPDEIKRHINMMQGKHKINIIPKEEER